MWLLVFAGLLAISVGGETIPNIIEKSKISSDNADDIVMLEIDVKDPMKRSPISANAEYEVPSNQYILQSADGTQEEYLASQYAEVVPDTHASPAQRNLQPAYAKQQQALQQAYYNYRKPAVVPSRPRVQLHPQALAQAEAVAEIQAHVDAQNRAEAIRSARLGSSSSNTPVYEASSYSQPKLGTFEQELLQLVSANQAQEFKLLPTQPKGSTSAYTQQLVSYPSQYFKQNEASTQLPEQYHIETSPPRYQQGHSTGSFQSVEQPSQYETIQSPKTYNPSAQYDYISDNEHLKALERNQAQSQAQAEAQALAFQKIAQAAYKKHQQDALEAMRQTNERYKQQSALQQIQYGSQVSDAGRNHLREQIRPKDPEAAYRAKLKAQAAIETAEARKLQQAAEFKAHADAIRKLEAQQQAHLKIQEEVHNYALNFEKNQMQAQALAQAQAEALYKSQLQARNQVNNEILAISKGQVQGQKAHPSSPVYHYTLSTTTPLPLLNNYFTNDQLQKYQASGSSHVPRSVVNPIEANPDIESVGKESQSLITQAHQLYKLKTPSSPQPVYVGGSALLKKSPVKSTAIADIKAEQVSGRSAPQTGLVHDRTLTEEDLSVLINAGYSVTPVSHTPKGMRQIYASDGTSVGYSIKKQKTPISKTEHVNYEEVPAHKLSRKIRPTPKHDEKEAFASEKPTYLIPAESVFGTRRHEI